MKFTDGYWLTREGFEALHAVEVDEVRVDEAAGTVTVFAPTGRVRERGDTINLPLMTMTYSSPAEGVVRVRVQHHAGGVERGPRFALTGAEGFRPTISDVEDEVRLTSGTLTVRVGRSGPWRVDFLHRDEGESTEDIHEATGHGGNAAETQPPAGARHHDQIDAERPSTVGEGPATERLLTSSLTKSIGHMTETATGRTWVHEQLSIAPGELVYGLGERFGPFVKNGQTVEMWNADGGTSSEQTYINVPFYMTTGGYGVFVDHAEKVSFEVASEVNSRVQFSVPGETLDYLVIDGPTPRDVLRRYTALTGRPPLLPEWSYGLWLSTSFSTDYDEATITQFIDGMAERDLPLSVFHFDCFWMRQFQWTDFTWDERMFDDPAGLLARLHDRGLKVCVWINPYIAQKAAAFDEARRLGYLLRRDDGSVWQWDMWQAGMGIVDFTNPDAAAWYTDHLRRLLKLGVDCFKTDFGERIPTDGVVWHDGSDPAKMRNYYAHIYNKAVFDLLREVKGEGEAVVFARSGTAGGQTMPVHWGGDCFSTFASMAETLRGGLSLALSGYSYWSHDIGGFEGAPDPAVFKRWLAFGLLSSHSRLHGGTSVRVPWAFGDEAVEVARRFITLKLSLLPYLMRLSVDAHETGAPVLRPMVFEFPDDRGAWTADTQYMLGDSLLVAPVFRDDGQVTYYVPEGRWTRLLDDEASPHPTVVEGPGWVTEQHGFLSLPLLVRPGAVLPVIDK
ncbi:MAG: alpha-xylosidase [Propionibacteriaceae bacterium]|jgi:alpha-D-xyloside xylohydrolase|nr:alpha-xylosidase [Propionibacteriaceae bacterium]